VNFIAGKAAQVLALQAVVFLAGASLVLAADTEPSGKLLFNRDVRRF